MSYTVLAIETAGTASSVALRDADGQSSTRMDEAGRQHSRSVLGMIDELLHAAQLRPHELELLAWNAGPGSFTGLRIGASVIQAMAYACSLPVLSLSSLELQAFAVARKSDWAGIAQKDLLVAIDAGMGSVYCARFSWASGALARVSQDVLLPKPDLSALFIESAGSERLLCAGNAWDGITLPDGVEQVQGYDVTAKDVVDLALTKPQLAWITDPACCLPHYVHQGQQWQKRQYRSVGRS